MDIILKIGQQEIIINIQWVIKSTFDVLCVFSYDDYCSFAFEKCMKIGEELLLKEEIDESKLAMIN